MYSIFNWGCVIKPKSIWFLSLVALNTFKFKVEYFHSKNFKIENYFFYATKTLRKKCKLYKARVNSLSLYLLKKNVEFHKILFLL